MKRFFKWVGIVFGVIVGLFVLLIVIVQITGDPEENALKDANKNFKGDPKDRDRIFSQIKENKTVSCPKCNLEGLGLAAYIKYSDTIQELNGANLSGANLKNVDFEKVTLKKANLSNADLRNANFWVSKLNSANLSGSDLRGANFFLSDLPYAKLTGANLSKAELEKVDLKHADLSGANLTNASLKEAKLQGAILQGANLSSANLKFANLTGAILKGANLKNVNWAYATVTDLTGAIVDIASLKNVDNCTVILPSGEKGPTNSTACAKRKKEEKRKELIAFSEKLLKRVQNGSLNQCPNQTIKEGVDNFLGSPVWTNGVSKTGIAFVNVKGNITYMGNPATAMYQFLADGESFKINTVDLNGTSQNTIWAIAMAGKLCGSKALK